MKLAFLSDIHGNATALEAVLNELNQQEIDKIYILGDLCFRGPEPKRVLEIIHGLSNVEVIKGNADEWLTDGFRDGEFPEDALAVLNEERNWTLQRLTDEDLDYLIQLPKEILLDELDSIIHAFHATPDSLYEVVPADDAQKIEDVIMQKDEADIYIYGHTHIPYVRSMHGKSVINTGSVGLPFDGHPLASYVVVDIEEGRHRFHLNRVPYNREHVVELYRQSGYPNLKALGTVIYYGVRP
ncbi:metallophosphoesterase family protein [Alkalicoccobacillus porphyridii]|uniref:Phosphoesterase n=1 Tax=Alkalicoccobacillus porphyridii TaxID=2597270 RepID=A0A553ZZU4_9BACI|nr:YfcE family phosphodiesterase [Alkalicoccobacillus porphyridii]TSB46968.1 metallophosphoesterase family protein [Alkalicoccobacillus porphyridii]